MDYDRFTAELASTLENLGYDKEKLTFSETQKNNGVTCRTLTIRSDLPIAPNISLEMFLEEYANGRDITISPNVSMGL